MQSQKENPASSVQTYGSGPNKSKRNKTRQPLKQNTAAGNKQRHCKHKDTKDRPN